MKIAIVRVIRNPDNYFFDLFDAATAGTLRSRGHDAIVVERIAAPGFDESDLLDGLFSFLVDFEPRLVFLSYLPTADLAARIKEFTGATVVVFGSRLLLAAPGVDYVIAEPDPLACNELVEVLEGTRPQAAVAALRWQEGGAQRSSGKPLHAVVEIFSRCDIDYGAFYRLGPGRAPEIRKHIAADWGCAYRHTKPADGIVSAVTLPPDVPSGGCTFCTRPAWSPMDWSVTGPLLGKQFDAVCSAFPDLAKLIVIDEHVLSYVDELAILLADRPVEALEVLLSGRLDHIPRYQRTIREAAKRLDGICTLAFYQFGIENLADSVLGRYNKGLSWPQIRNALEVMNKLVADYPNLAVEQSFGFILFDPWTTLEELRTNVLRAREINLDRYRGRAAHTSLRLLPEMALYWRAKADGLLSGSIEENLFGYSVNSGWRFQHPEVASVFQAFNSRRGEQDDWMLLESIMQ
jgi:hypothetical protein